MPEPVLTLFSTPKPFTDPHIAMIQKNAIRSWKQLGNRVEVVLIGEEAGVKQVAMELDVRFIPGVHRNEQGTPLISSMFELARKVNSSPLLGIINTDVIVFPELIYTCQKVADQSDRFVLAGQRWDLKVDRPIQFKPDWVSKLKSELAAQGRRHPPAGSDYFIFPRACYSSMPDFAIGRAGWDNWMIFKARWEHWKVIEATEAINIIHQDHDYSHLPKGQTHHKVPETYENVRLAGGKRTIFTLTDANYILKDSKIHRKKLTFRLFWRKVEICPIINLHSFTLGNITFGLLHPIRAYQEYRTSKSNSKRHLSVG